MKRALFSLSLLTLAGCFNWDEGVKNCTQENGCLKKGSEGGGGGGGGGVPSTPPGQPTAVTATAGNGVAVLTWSAPVDPGSTAISSYRVTSSPGSATATTTGQTTATVSGLMVGSSYTFTVIASNEAGDGPPSEPSNALTIITAPAAPSAVMALAESGKATVSWSAPTNTGGSPITGYTVTSAPSGIFATSTGTSAVVIGLINGTGYSFSVTARNAVGEGPASSASNTVTPATVPEAPTAVTASGGNTQALVQWTAPGDDGGSAITGYIVTAFPGGRTAMTSGATQATVTGLLNATAYTFTVRASNVAGEGPDSAASNSVTPAAVPGPPTGVLASPGNASVLLQWTAPADTGGSPITGYTVTSTPGGFTASTTGATTATVTGLTIGTSYTFNVFATNGAGNGIASTSNSVTVIGIPSAPTSVVASVGGSAGAVVQWVAPASTGGSPITLYTVTSSPGGLTATSSGALNATVTGLTIGLSYTFTVRATNLAGDGPGSMASNALTPIGLPGAPRGPTALSLNTRAIVSWRAPVANGGGAIIGYTVTSSPGGLTGSSTGATRATVPGLTNNISYTFTVTASNAAGAGPASPPSNSATPSPACLPAAVFNSGAPTFAVGSGPLGIAAGDFDADGKPDLATANAMGNSVSVLLGDGLGAFAAAVPYAVAVGSGPRGIVAGDWNGDDRLDLATADYNISKVSVFLGNGPGTFQAAASFDVGTNSASLTQGDFNGDGRLDLATASSGKVNMCLGVGNGTFLPAIDSTLTGAPNAITSGDFNSDGLLDVATANSLNASVALGRGDGTFQTATNHFAGTLPTGITSGYFNGDNNLDLAISAVTSGEVGVLLGTSTGVFPTTATAYSTAAPSAVVAGDFNRDDLQDLALVSGGGTTLSVLFGTGTGAFGPPVVLPVGTNPYSLITGDFNRDGRLDIAVANYMSNTVSVLLNLCQ